MLFVADFSESTIKESLSRWGDVKDRENFSLSSELPVARPADHSLLVTHVGGKGAGGHLYRTLPKGEERVFLRFYTRFDRDCAPIHHFVHFGGYQPLTAWLKGGAGVRPDGAKRFTLGLEPHAQRWTWDYYAYWKDMGEARRRGRPGEAA